MASDKGRRIVQLMCRVGVAASSYPHPSPAAFSLLLPEEGGA